MSKADDIQIGGSHYKSRKVQHWTYAAQLPYLEGLATKYLDRHRLKGGKQDLLKAIHTIEKMIEEYYPDEAPTSAEVALGLPEVSFTPDGLCARASDGLHKFSHVYKHGKDGRLKEVLKCDLCNEEQERKA